MRLAEQAGLYGLARDLVHVPGHQGSNQEVKIATLVAGMVAGADSITDMDMLRHGGMGKLFGDTRAPSTLGSFLRRFTFGHARQVDALCSRFLVGLDRRCPFFGCRDAASPVMVDLDDTIVEVFGAAKQGARIGYTKVRGLDVLLMTATTDQCAPVIIANRLRKGSANSARGVVKFVQDGLATLRRTSVANRQVWLRADSGFTSAALVNQVMSTGGWISVTMGMTGPIRRAIATIGDHQWTPIEYPHPVVDPDSGGWVSRAEVAEIAHTAFATVRHTRPILGRLVVRRVPDWQAADKIAAGQDPLFAAWRYHAFFTTVPADQYDTVKVDTLHRQHAVIEQVNAALKDSALAHLPSGKFAANSVWVSLACLAFNLTRALGILTSDPRLAVAVPATIRRTLVLVPARIASSARTIIVHLPLNWKWATS